MIVVAVLLVALGGCSRQQSDWQKARQTNTAEGYEQFLKRYPNGDFTVQAQARLKDLYTERDWQKARDADTPDAYQAFVTQHPEGKLADEARGRIENFNLAQAPAGSEAAPASAPSAGPAPSASSAPPATPGESPAAGAATPAPVAGGGAAARVPPQRARIPPAAAGAATPGTHGPATASTAPSATASAKRFGVQLGAFRAGGAAAAHRRWVALKKQYPQLLKGLSPKVVATKTTTGTLYRLQALGVSENGARHICKSLRAKSQACIVLPPSRA